MVTKCLLLGVHIVEEDKDPTGISMRSSNGNHLSLRFPEFVASVNEYMYVSIQYYV